MPGRSFSGSSTMVFVCAGTQMTENQIRSRNRRVEVRCCDRCSGRGGVLVWLLASRVPALARVLEASPGRNRFSARNPSRRCRLSAIDFKEATRFAVFGSSPSPIDGNETWAVSNRVTSMAVSRLLPARGRPATSEQEYLDILQKVIYNLAAPRQLRAKAQYYPCLRDLRIAASPPGNRRANRRLRPSFQFRDIGWKPRILPYVATKPV